jgi:hypothetical protein
MSLNFAHHLGSDNRMRTQRLGLFSDGETLALHFANAFHLLPNFQLRNLQMESRLEVGQLYTNTYSFEIVTFQPPIVEYSSTKIHDLFQNANNMSVDELLKLAYHRMDARAS